MRFFRSLVLATAAVVGVLLASARADAHAMHAKVEVRADAVKLEAYFDEDLPAELAEAVVTDADGAEVLTGKTDEHGAWTFPPPKPGAYVVTVKLTGHRTKVPFVIAAESEGPVVSTDPRVNKWLGLAIGAGALLGLSAAFWFFRRARKVR